MRSEAISKQGVYSRRLRAKLFFLRDIAAHSTYGRLLLVSLQALTAKGINFTYAVLEQVIKHRVQCPACGWMGLRFRTVYFGSYVRKDCACPRCRSMERHRSYFLYYSGLERMRHKVILYFAPEPSLYLWLAKQRSKLILSDLVAPGVHVRADLMCLPFKNGVVDAIINHHVLEHISDDAVALEELERILKADGRLFIAVPINESRAVTLDWGFPDPVKQGHFREYGRDFAHRLGRFKYTAIDIPTKLSPDMVRRYGLAASELLYVCEKRFADC
jgi:SAM-dependent methyltransferase